MPRNPETLMMGSFATSPIYLELQPQITRSIGQTHRLAIAAAGASHSSRTYNKARMIPNRHTRRSFLQGQAAASELGKLVQQRAQSSAAPSGRSAFIVSVCRRAMACE